MTVGGTQHGGLPLDRTVGSRGIARTKTRGFVRCVFGRPGRLVRR